MTRKYLTALVLAPWLACVVVPAAAMAAPAPKPAQTQLAFDPDEMLDQALPLMAKESKLLSVLMERVPEFKGELRSRMKNVITSLPQEAWANQLQVRSQALVEYYFSAHVPKASDESIYAMIALDKSYLDRYAGNPELCIGYALGSLDYMKVAPKEYIARVNELKSNIILSALDAPSSRVMPSNLDDVGDMLIKGYEKNGYPTADLALLESLGTVAPADACRAYTNFNDVMYDMGVKDGAYTMAVLTNAAPSVKP